MDLIWSLSPEKHGPLAEFSFMTHNRSSWPSHSHKFWILGFYSHLAADSPAFQFPHSLILSMKPPLQLGTCTMFPTPTRTNVLDGRENTTTSSLTIKWLPRINLLYEMILRVWSNWLPWIPPPAHFIQVNLHKHRIPEGFPPSP